MDAQVALEPYDMHEVDDLLWLPRDPNDEVNAREDLRKVWPTLLETREVGELLGRRAVLQRELPEPALEYCRPRA